MNDTDHTAYNMSDLTSYIDGTDTAFVQFQVHHFPERPKPISSTKELSATAVLYCHTSPMVHPTGIHEDDLPSKI